MYTVYVGGSGGADLKIYSQTHQTVFSFFPPGNNNKQVANSNPTAASMSTDLYGMATLDACQQINVRAICSVYNCCLVMCCF